MAPKRGANHAREVRVEREERSGQKDFARFEGSPDFVLSLARGLQVIEAFETNTAGVSVAEVARHTKLSRAAVRRLLLTLEMLGYAESDGRIYRLKPRVLRLGYSYFSSTSLAAIAEPILQRASEAAREALAMCVLEGEEVAYLVHCGPPRVMSVGVSVGTRLPAHCTSGGRVLLAALPVSEFEAYVRRATLKACTPRTITRKEAFVAAIEKVRRDGFALVDQELELGLRSLAVPVRSRHNAVVAAINTGIHSARVSEAEMIDKMLPILHENAAILGRQLS